jgi:hypothetical protein
MFLRSVVPLARKGLFLGVLSLWLAVASSRAAIVVDYSPDATGAGLAFSMVNEFGNQAVGGSFTLSDETAFSGAAIFGGEEPAFAVGTPVKVLVFSDPTQSPVISFDAAIDTVDSLHSTTQPELRRFHASFAEFNLTAGTYWFAMSPVGILATHMTGYFGDGIIYYGPGDTLPGFSDVSGKPFFQLENNAIPEPTAAALLALGGCTVFFRVRQRR